MIFKRIILFLWIYLVSCTLFFSLCFGQSYHFKNYSAEQGLPFVQVYAVFQDSKGNLWTGGYGGLSKFDGKTFTNYSPKNGLANHWVTSISEDTQGNIWIGTISGLTKYDGRSFTTFTKKHGLTGEYINSVIADNNGNMWIATTEGITIYDGKSFSTLTRKNGLTSNNISLIYADKNGSIWMNTEKGVGKIVFTNTNSQDKSFDNYSVINGIYDTAITSATEDDHGNLWFGTNSGVMKYDGVVFKKYSVKDGLFDNAIQAVQKDNNSNDIWVGTLKGLNKISENGRIESFLVSEVQNGNKIGKLQQDAEGNLWLGTSNGLYRFRDPSFAVFSDKDGLINPFVFPIFRDSKKNLWVGTLENGFYKYDGKGFRNFSEKDGLIGNFMCAGTEDKEGNIWMGTNKGVSVYNGSSFRNFHGRKDGLHGDSVTAIIQDSKGRIWLGGNKGGTIWNGNKFKTFDLKSEEKNFDIWYLFEDSKGFVWMGTYLGGLFRYDPKKDMGSPEKAIENMSKKLNLKSKTYLSIEEDREGNIYLGSFDGLYIYNEASGKISLVSEKEGLCSDLIYVMAFDTAREYLYIGSNQGMNKFDTKEYKRTGKIILEQYGQEEGFSSLETNSNGIWRDEDGTLWFGTVNGLIRYNPYSYNENTSESKTSIRNIRIFYNDTVLPDNSELPYYLNNISFEYIGICLTNPEKVRYKYMLQGLDKTWSPETKETAARFPNLQPARYVFKVISCNNEGVWNKEPATFSFVITPPVWKTWWFRISSALAALILIVLFLRMRAKAIRKKEGEKLSREIELANNELKALRAQMDPHFIFNSLSSIQSFIMSKDEDSAVRYLNKFAKLMRMILSNSEKSSITIREEIDALKLYLELEALRWDNKFEYSVQVDPKVEADEFKIPTMLIQPYVENAVIHGVVPKDNGKGKVEVTVSQTDTHIICIVQDNGIGRKRSQELRTESNKSLHESMGMKITNERLQVLNKMHRSNLSLNIIDLEDKNGNALGTKVEIFIPL